MGDALSEMLWQPSAPIETGRLRLRRFSPGDLQALHDLHSRPDVVRYVSWPAHVDLEDSRRLLETRMAVRGLAADGDKLVLAVTEKDTGALIGEVALILVNRELQQGEIGFILHPHYHGRGLAYEASAAILHIAFAMAGFRRVIGRCDARNHASAGLLGKLGLRREAHFRQAERVKGEWVDRLIFAALAEEHPWGPDRTLAASPPI